MKFQQLFFILLLSILVIISVGQVDEDIIDLSVKQAETEGIVDQILESEFTAQDNVIEETINHEAVDENKEVLFIYCIHNRILFTM